MRRGSRRRHRLDSNHKAIELALRKVGWQTINLSSIGGACPDLLVQRRGRMMLVEVKTAEGQLTPEQMAFRLDGWPVTIIRSVDEVLKLDSETRMSEQPAPQQDVFPLHPFDTWREERLPAAIFIRHVSRGAETYDVLPAVQMNEGDMLRVDITALAITRNGVIVGKLIPARPQAPEEPQP